MCGRAPGSVIDIDGEVTGSAETALTDAYARPAAVRNIVLNFSEFDYMNSSGIGLLVTLLVRANRQRQKLLAYGLNDHYRQIFDLTRLDEAIGIYENEAAALAEADAPDRGARRAHQPRDAAYWAKDVTTLQVGDVPAEAINLNVTGRRVVGPVQGFGKMWQKTIGSS